MFGRAPTKPKALHWRVYDTDREAIGGLATRKQVKIYIAEGDNGPAIDLLLYIPNGAKQPVPLFMGLNFHGNQSIALDPAITITTSWIRPDKKLGIENNRADERL